MPGSPENRIKSLEDKLAEQKRFNDEAKAYIKKSHDSLKEMVELVKILAAITDGHEARQVKLRAEAIASRLTFGPRF